MTAEVDLHDALSRYSYNHAFFCTFNFDSTFFEEYCLDRFDSLATTDEITVIMDAKQLDCILAGDRASWPRSANVRYLLHGARPRGSFHPKVFLLCSKTRGMLMVGSANLTKAGLTQNAELVRTFTFELGKREEALGLFQAAKSFLDTLGDKWPSNELSERLADLSADTPWLRGVPASLPVRLLHNLAVPLLPQLTETLEQPVREFAVISPFFDEEPRLLDWVAKQVAPETTTIYTTNGARTLTPSWVKHGLLTAPGSRLLFSAWGDDERTRQLHGKAIAIRHGDFTRVAFGSANFTRAALLSTPTDGNVEAILVLDDLPHASVDIGKLFDPAGTGAVGELVAQERQPELPAVVHSLSLIEARLENSFLSCVLREEEREILDATLHFQDGEIHSVRLKGSGVELVAEVPDAVARRAGSMTTVVFLRGSEERESNRVLLLNLLDPSTGKSMRKERRVRDAERNADQFSGALLELLKMKDTDPLKSFLTHCDIRVVSAGQPRVIAREALSLGIVQDGLRGFGEDNLRSYKTLQSAVLGFCERHTARLSRHARKPSIEGITGAMHIVRAIAGVLGTQIERLLAGLVSVETISIEDWFQCRTALDQLLSQWISLLRVVHAEWLVSLQEVFATEDIRAAIGPDLEKLKEFVQLFTDSRARVLAETKHFRVRTPNGQRVEPPVVPDNTLHQSSWKRWVDEVVLHQTALVAAGM